jgi:hypothetical protein
MKRFVIVTTVVFAGVAIIICASLIVFSRALLSADAYPAFMANDQSSKPQSYEEARRFFSDFVARTFPIGSDASDAIKRITKGDFQVTSSTSETVALVFARHAGPCNEQYSILISRDANGRIAKILGELRPICL